MSSTPLPRVLITRAAEDAGSLSHAVAEAGFQPVEAPAIARVWDIDAMVDLAERAGDAELLVVTSGTIADVLATGAPRAWRNARVAAVGQATAARLQALGLTVDVVPRKSTAAALVEALGDLSGIRVAWPHGDLAPESTREALEAAGAELSTAVVYRNLEPPGFPERLQRMLPVDALTLLSGSAARRIAALVPEAERWKLGRVVVIGPSTLEEARECGLEVHAMASPHSIQGLLSALRGLFGFVR